MCTFLDRVVPYITNGRGSEQTTFSALSTYSSLCLDNTQSNHKKTRNTRNTQLFYCTKCVVRNSSGFKEMRSTINIFDFLSIVCTFQDRVVPYITNRRGSEQTTLVHSPDTGSTAACAWTTPSQITKICRIWHQRVVLIYFIFSYHVVSLT